jgi:hypothetical protein
MKRVSVIACLVLLGMVPALPAQQPYPPAYGRGTIGPYSRPTLSPYLNMLRGGSPSANYFLGVNPEFQRRANTATFSTAIEDLERRANENVVPEAEDLLPTLPGTGHPVAFNNLGSYFNATPTPRQAPIVPLPSRTGRTR